MTSAGRAFTRKPDTSAPTLAALGAQLAGQEGA